MGLTAMLQAQVESDATGSTGKSPRIRVLIVERHPAVRRALSQRLGVQSQLDVVGAVDSLERLPVLPDDLAALTGNRSVDILLLGLQNGTEDELLSTLASVRRLAQGTLSIVVLAPYADEVERAMLREVGVEHYLLKQIDSTLLIQEIEAAAHGASPVAD